MKQLFDSVSHKCSRITTNAYSTSFSAGIRLLDKKLHPPIYAIYGFVRFADEIVDSFHDFPKEKLLKEFKGETYRAIEDKISLNPILNSFQWAVNKYNIEKDLIDTFLNSMEMDLNEKSYGREGYETYILGSAEVVGLMCLKVFCEGDQQMYERLKGPAMRLGAAFQKINFLRDIKDDYVILGRNYFPEVDFEHFTEEAKKKLEEEIEVDFNEGLKGIKMLPKSARAGVYLAYTYYRNLFSKIRKTPVSKILTQRVRVPDNEKFFLLARTFLTSAYI
jgi:15-cis-phytoene synthase